MTGKRALDVVVSSAALVVLLPVIAVAAAAVLLTSRGGALHRALRVGLGGAPFTMLKLRTMRVAAGPRVTAGDDPRVTAVGRVLRFTHLDETPQLWNVLRGEMSLVGPRPEDPALVDLGDPRWQRVLSIRPGITGPTQLVWGRREAELLRGADAEQVYRRDVLPAKLASDLAYVTHRSLGADLLVLLRTCLLPFRGPGTA